MRLALDESRVADALEGARRALLEAPGDPELLRLAADALLRSGERDGVELFTRAADAPDDLARMVELGSHLLSREAPELACAFLSRALSFAPFDAMIRSELAIAQARSGRPHDAVETLALHPCLADDPGALFELAWSSLLTGDRGTAEGARRELERHGLGRALRDKLDCALRRAQVPHAAEPADARDYLFLEHGSVLLACDGPHRGRHGVLTVTEPMAAALLGRAAAVVTELVPRPRRIMAADEGAEPWAAALADAAGGERVPLGAGRLASGVVVARRAADLEPLAERLRAAAGEVLSFALVLDWSRGLSATPDLVGVLAREARIGDAPAARPDGDAALLDFVRTRRAHLPPAGRRVPTAYVPDAPLPWP